MYFRRFCFVYAGLLRYARNGARRRFWLGCLAAIIASVAKQSGIMKSTSAQNFKKMHANYNQPTKTTDVGEIENA